MALIELRGIKKAFRPKVVFEDLDLDIYDGESLSIIGASGQGKSVLLKMLIGLSDRLAMLHEGRIIFEGTPEQIRDASDPRVRDFIEGNAPAEEDTETLMQASG